MNFTEFSLHGVGPMKLERKDISELRDICRERDIPYDISTKKSTLIRVMLDWKEGPLVTKYDQYKNEKDKKIEEKVVVTPEKRKIEETVAVTPEKRQKIEETVAVIPEKKKIEETVAVIPEKKKIEETVVVVTPEKRQKIEETVAATPEIKTDLASSKDSDPKFQELAVSFASFYVSIMQTDPSVTEQIFLTKKLLLPEATLTIENLTLATCEVTKGTQEIIKKLISLHQIGTLQFNEVQGTPSASGVCVSCDGAIRFGDLVNTTMNLDFYLHQVAADWVIDEIKLITD